MSNVPSPPQTAAPEVTAVAQSDPLAALRDQLSAVIAIASLEELTEVAAVLGIGDPLREGTGADDVVVGYAGERAVTMGTLRERARDVDGARERGELLTVEQVRAKHEAWIREHTE